MTPLMCIYKSEQKNYSPFCTVLLIVTCMISQEFCHGFPPPLSLWSTVLLIWTIKPITVCVLFRIPVWACSVEDALSSVSINGRDRAVTKGSCSEWLRWLSDCSCSRIVWSFVEDVASNISLTQPCGCQAGVPSGCSNYLMVNRFWDRSIDCVLFWFTVRACIVEDAASKIPMDTFMRFSRATVRIGCGDQYAWSVLGLC